jgi:heme/copper-type cytochrome/quinol oxidase subunit 4
MSLDTVASTASIAPATPDRFNLSPIVRITLLSLYVALTVPLPFLAAMTEAAVPPVALWVGIVIGAVFLYGVLSERVLVDDEGIRVVYPAWVPWRSGWSLRWDEIVALKPRSTGQGGLVYYFTTQAGQGYLLPMRIAGFARLVARVEAQTGIETADVKPLSQPWMYLILFSLTVMLGLVDLWAIAAAQGWLVG